MSSGFRSGAFCLGHFHDREKFGLPSGPILMTSKNVGKRQHKALPIRIPEELLFERYCPYGISPLRSYINSQHLYIIQFNGNDGGESDDGTQVYLPLTSPVVSGCTDCWELETELGSGLKLELGVGSELGLDRVVVLQY